MLSNGAPINAVSEYLGHKNLTTTSTYVKSSLAKSMKVLENEDWDNQDISAAKGTDSHEEIATESS